jgi:hypothetical protein
MNGAHRQRNAEPRDRRAAMKTRDAKVRWSVAAGAEGEG